jgi:hypothetical protein
MTIEEIKEDLSTYPVDINGEFRNPIKLVTNDTLFQQCVNFWHGIEEHSNSVSGIASTFGSLEKIKMDSLKSIQWGIKKVKVDATLSNPEHLKDPVIVAKTKRGLVLLDGNTRAFILNKMNEKEILAYVIEVKKHFDDGTKLFEQILKDNGTFYDFVKNELHDIEGADIQTQEPKKSKYSCFDYDNVGDDSPDERDGVHVWNDCRLTMDDDGLYWVSASEKDACLLIYTIVKLEAKEGKIVLHIAPIDSSEDEGIVYIYKK